MLLDVHRTFLFLPFFWPLLPNHCRCIKLLLPSTTHSGKQKRWAGLLWTRDRPVAETSTWQNTKFTTDRHPCCSAGFEPAVPTSEQPQTYVLDCASAIVLSVHVTVTKPDDSSPRSVKFCHLFASQPSTLTLTAVNYICCHICLTRDYFLDYCTETCLFYWFDAKKSRFYLQQNANSNLHCKTSKRN